jgi:hypothetical protein
MFLTGAIVDGERALTNVDLAILHTSNATSIAVLPTPTINTRLLRHCSAFL